MVLHQGWIAIVATCTLGCGRFGFGPGDVVDASPSDASNDSYAKVVIADGPTAFWRFEELSDTHRDEMGRHDSVQVGVSARGLGASTPQVGVGDLFDGIDDSITFADHQDFEVASSSFTIEVVLEIDFLGVNYRRLISHEVYGDAGWYLSIHESPSWGLAFSRWAEGSERYAASGLSAVPLDTLLHVVAVYDAVLEEMLLYINGDLRGTGGGGVAGTVGDIVQDVVIGRPSELASQYFPGRIYEAAFYNGKALSAEQVGAHFEALQLP